MNISVGNPIDVFPKRNGAKQVNEYSSASEYFKVKETNRLISGVRTSIFGDSFFGAWSSTSRT